VAKLGLEASGVAAILCFTITKTRRGRRLTGAVLDAVVAHGRTQGWSAIEAYPFDAEAASKHGDDVAWPGPTEAFERGGFERIGSHWLDHPEYPRSIWRRALG
jgi:hypothetical protein